MDYYGTVAAFRIYHIARGRDVAAMSDSTVTKALLIASEWLDGRYRSRYAGIKKGDRTQIREWPRSMVVDITGWSIPNDIIPTEVENATYEAAFEESKAAGSLTKNFTPSLYSQVSITGAVHAQFNSNKTAADMQTQYPLVDQAIAPVLMIGSGNASGLSGEGVR
jgi:hypothetical protein